MLEINSKHPSVYIDLKSSYNLLYASKMDYAIDTDERVRSPSVKLDFPPIMRDGIEFEFSLIHDLDMNHKVVLTE